MRKKLNSFGENLLRLAFVERLRQLEKKEDNPNIIKKQLELDQIADELVMTINHCPKGLIEIVFTDKKFSSDTHVSRILLNSMAKVSSFNITDPEQESILFRTVIVIDPMWSDKFKIYQSEYGLPDGMLKTYKNYES